MKEFKITRNQLQEIYNIACTAWKSRINKLTIDTLGAFENEGVLSETTVKEMFTAADSSQKEVLTRIFPDYGKINIPDKDFPEASNVLTNRSKPFTSPLSSLVAVSNPLIC